MGRPPSSEFRGIRRWVLVPVAPRGRSPRTASACWQRSVLRYGCSAVARFVRRLTPEKRKFSFGLKVLENRGLLCWRTELLPQRGGDRSVCRRISWLQSSNCAPVVGIYVGSVAAGARAWEGER